MSFSPTGLHGTSQTYYEILDISPALLSDKDHHQPSQLVKRAYHRALLRHHPDKAKSEPAIVTPSPAHSPTARSSRSGPVFTIDQITVAYKTLSDPKSRAAYDLSLRAASAKTNGPFGYGGQQNQGGPGATSFQTGVENVDLDDLPFDEAQDCWYRDCRCGNDRGFTFAEADLEEAGGAGELLVGCRDCSLWMKVHFAIVDE